MKHIKGPTNPRHQVSISMPPPPSSHYSPPQPVVLSYNTVEKIVQNRICNPPVPAFRRNIAFIALCSALLRFVPYPFIASFYLLSAHALNYSPLGPASFSLPALLVLTYLIEPHLSTPAFKPILVRRCCSRHRQLNRFILLLHRKQRSNSQLHLQKTLPCSHKVDRLRQLAPEYWHYQFWMRDAIHKCLLDIKANSFDCVSISVLMMVYLLKNQYSGTIERMYRITLSNNKDTPHSFVVAGRTQGNPQDMTSWNDDCWILDLWYGLCLQKNTFEQSPHYNQQYPLISPRRKSVFTLHRGDRRHWQQPVAMIINELQQNQLLDDETEPYRHIL